VPLLDQEDRTGLPVVRVATGTVRRRTSRVIRFRCMSCGYEWLAQARNITRATITDPSAIGSDQNGSVDAD